ncbi:MAG: hypothetical protein LBB73_09320 [Dysgonamonadaceae bacterium]|jgi:hypothetical protein|nr:hypothetical protein [Dysgonamonadaceae bacterium]
MKTDKKKKEFDAVQFMRQVRDKISAEICDMSPEQILEYFKQRVPKERIMPAL